MDQTFKSAGEKVMLKYFVEISDKDKGIAKFVWPSIWSKGEYCANEKRKEETT